jgi:hypothetical protein
MKDFPGRWGICGGWAIDLFLQRESRPHSDIDVAVLRADQQHIRSRLPVDRAQKVVAHQLCPWSVDEDLQPPVHEIHATWPDGYHLEFLLNDHDRPMQQWLFRRDHRIRRPLVAAFPSTQGIPYLAPEIVLLYKSKAPATKDDDDFASVLPHLAAEQRAWLHEALRLTAPGHRWGDLIAREA